MIIKRSQLKNLRFQSSVIIIVICAFSLFLNSCGSREENAQKTTKINPNISQDTIIDEIYYYDLGKKQMAELKYTEAIKCFDKAIAINSNIAELY